MNENRVRQFLLKLKIATNEIDDLNNKLKKYLNIQDKSSKQLVEEVQSKHKEQNSLDTINLEDELDVFGQVHKIGQEFRDTFETEAIDEMEDELKYYKGSITLELEDTEYDTITRDKETFKHEIEEDLPNLSNNFKNLINESYYFFHHEVDDLIFLLEQYFKFRKKYGQKVVSDESLTLGSEVYLTYRHIDELFSRISLINNYKIKRLSDKQKRQLDSIVNLIHSLN